MVEPKHLEMLKDSSVFAGIPADQVAPLLDGLGARVRSVASGALFRGCGEALDFYPVVIAGCVQSTMLQGGLDRPVATFGSGESFAEAVPSKLKVCPVDIHALEDTKILCIPAAALEASASPHAATLRSNLAGGLAAKIGVLSRTLSVLGEPRLSDRILAYLRTLPLNDDGSVSVPASRSEWADKLRVAEKSLIRELKRMQDAGIVKVEGRNIIIF